MSDRTPAYADPNIAEELRQWKEAAGLPNLRLAAEIFGTSYSSLSHAAVGRCGVKAANRIRGFIVQHPPAGVKEMYSVGNSLSDAAVAIIADALRKNGFDVQDTTTDSAALLVEGTLVKIRVKRPADGGVEIIRAHHRLKRGI